MASTTAAAESKVPVTVLTGFLGSGKTTLLNYILSQKHGLKVAVIENEFGDVGVDDDLVRKKYETEEEIFEMNNGCICCTVRGDLIRILSKILRRKTKFDAIIIETTGLADPAPVAQTFFVDESLQAQARLDGIITVVDAKHILMHLDEKKAAGVENEAVEQVAFADRLLINKTDLVDAATLREVRERLRALNPTAKQIECQHAKVPLEEVLGMRAFSLEHILQSIDPDFLAVESDESDVVHGDGHGHGHGHGHASGACATGCTKAHEHHHHHETAGSAGGGQRTKKRHVHDTTISSVGIQEEGELDMDKLNAWIGDLLKTKGADIYRMKGVFAIKGMENKFVFQGVHMMLDASPLEGVVWKDGEKRVNKCVFIGKKLDGDQLRKDFSKCLT